MRIQPIQYCSNKKYYTNNRMTPVFKSSRGDSKESPIILEQKDIAIYEPSTYWQVTQKGNDGRYYQYCFRIDQNQDGKMPVQGESTSWTSSTKGNSSHYIYNAWEDIELRNILRAMQFNNGEIPQSTIAGYEAEYIYMPEELGISKEEWMHRYPTKESYVQSKKNEIYDNLKGQIQELKRLKPTPDDCILYRGISLNKYGRNKDYINFIDMYRHLKEGETVILDWASMCATSNIDYAICAGSDILRIKVPKGSRLVHGTNEYRFPSKSKFRFNKKNDYNGISIWDFEYITPKY